MRNCTILIRKGTREKLKHLGRKTQTYDDLINQLIEKRLKMELPMKEIKDKNKVTPVGQRFDPLAQQASGEVQ